MKRSELYRVRRPAGDRRPSRVFVIVSRPAVITSKYSTVICAPIYSRTHGLASEVAVGVGEGLKHDSSIHCDGLVSILKSALTDFVGSLSPEKEGALDEALRVALDID